MERAHLGVEIAQLLAQRQRRHIGRSVGRKCASRRLVLVLVLVLVLLVLLVLVLVLVLVLLLPRVGEAARPQRARCAGMGRAGTG